MIYKQRDTYCYLPEPVKVTDCGLLAALSVSLNVALKLPVMVGLNVTLMTQFLPALRVVPQVELDTENWVAFVPVMLQERLLTVPAPVLLTVTPLV